MGRGACPRDGPRSPEPRRRRQRRNGCRRRLFFWWRRWQFGGRVVDGGCRRAGVPGRGGQTGGPRTRGDEGPGGAKRGDRGRAGALAGGRVGGGAGVERSGGRGPVGSRESVRRAGALDARPHGCLVGGPERHGEPQEHERAGGGGVARRGRSDAPLQVLVRAVRFQAVSVDALALRAQEPGSERRRADLVCHHHQGVEPESCPRGFAVDLLRHGVS
mmetsp:Transcript_27534/g.49976  ORF Transcript_27534/g.49976 Transcript_27534/m.49976 type:complete len:217 (+) Transcript_27534:209-859(+)